MVNPNSELILHMGLRTLIEMYKILTGKYDVDLTPKVLRVYDSTTRGNMFKLNKG